MLRIGRIVLFSRDVAALSGFYGDVLQLPRVPGCEPGWQEFDAGGCRLALHKGGQAEKAVRAPKIVFACEDVAATRDRLNARGAAFGKVKVAGALVLCDGKDPEGNALQLSNRP